MSETNQAVVLAERLAEILAGADKREDTETKQLLFAVLTKLDDVTNRLANVESELRERREREPAAIDFKTAHPSLQQFEIAEAAQFLPGTNIKACAFEPNGKPCDNCAMCSSRGF